jgi:hypothetical protein
VEFQSELEQLGREALDGEMSVTELHDRVTDTMVRYLGSVPPDMQERLDVLMREYEGLHDEVQRLEVLKNFARSLGIDPDA